MSRRTTFNKEKRACAYDFALDALDRGGRPAGSTAAEQSPISPEPAGSDENAQQQLATGTDYDDDRAADRSRSATHEETSGVDDESAEQDSQPSSEAVTANLQQAITALQDLEDALDAA